MAIRPSIRAVFIDLDGTLLDPSLKLLETSRNALESARTAGVHIVLATGRPFLSASLFLPSDEVGNLLIVSNGGAVVESGSRRIVWAAQIADHTLETALKLAEELGLGLCAYDPLVWYAAGARELVDVEKNRSGTLPIGPIEVGRRPPPIKLMLIGPPPVLDRAKSRLQETERDSAHWFHTYPEYLEIMPRGVSKGQAVARVLEVLGLESSQAMAIGDGDNDLEMLEEVGLKIAVANASSALKAVADFIAPSNAADGVGVALKAFVHGDPAASRQLVSMRGGHD